MDYYKLRIDTHNVNLIQAMCEKYFTNYVYALENQGQDNPHVHLYVEMFTKQATLREYIRKTFGQGNRCYSLKSLDEKRPVEYLAYVIKEGDYKHNCLTPEELTLLHAHNKEVKTQIKARKADRKTVLERVLDLFKDVEFPDDTYPLLGEYFLSEEKIVEMVVEYYKEQGTLIREFQLVSICQTLCLKFLPDYKNDLKNKILDKIKN